MMGNGVVNSHNQVLRHRRETVERENVQANTELTRARTERLRLRNRDNDSDEDDDYATPGHKRNRARRTPNTEPIRVNRRIREEEGSETELEKSDNEGGSWLDQNDYVRKTRYHLNKYGHLEIISVKCVRIQVPGFINKIYGRIFDYDKLYHLAAIITLRNDDGQLIELMFEKQSFISLRRDFTQKNDAEVLYIPKPYLCSNLLELTDDMQNAMGDDYFSYSGRDNNCQVFLSYMITCLTGKFTPQQRAWILQDKIQGNKNLGPIGNMLTNLVTQTHGIIKGNILGGKNKY